ncbi:inactive hydroxysteroid dehydrogenase-like protein 1 [Branchiostoma floridae x Branchiostoma belcheri]
MAAVDRFSFLAAEISKTINYYNDILAILGAVYVGKKVLDLVMGFLGGTRVHFISRIAKPDLTKRYGPWAVVTGCTDGIGKAYAQELASRGLNIVLISRNQTKLENTAHTIESLFGVETAVIQADFSKGREIYVGIAETLRGKDVGILVNNVGLMYDHPQFFLEVPENRLWDIVNVNVATVTMMTHLVLPGMVERKRGAVVNIASASSLRPTPLMTAYSATKAYVAHFSQALQYEYKDAGITVQCLTPYYVATNMTAYSDIIHNPSVVIPSATGYARAALSTLGVSTSTTGYWPHTIAQWFATKLFSEDFYVWVAYRFNSALRRQVMEKKQRKLKSK